MHSWWPAAAIIDAHAQTGGLLVPGCLLFHALPTLSFAKCGAVLFVHTICVRNPKLKVPALQAAGFWFMDTLGNGEATGKVPGLVCLRPS